MFLQIHAEIYHGIFCLFKRFEEAERAARWGLQIDTTQIWIITNLAHSLLLQNKFNEAKNAYVSIKDKRDDIDNRMYKEIMIEDLKALEKAGIAHSNMKIIRELLHTQRKNQ